MGGGRPFCRRSRSFSLSRRSAERECGEWCRRSRERERRCRVRRVREVEREHLLLGDLGVRKTRMEMRMMKHCGHFI